MTRDELIQQVKFEYGEIASNESRYQMQEMVSTTAPSPEAYYEKLLNAVLTEIEKGTFDQYQSGAAIIEAVESDKSLLPEWE